MKTKLRARKAIKSIHETKKSPPGLRSMNNSSMVMASRAESQQMKVRNSESQDAIPTVKHVLN